jgi:hypothetical protein
VHATRLCSLAAAAALAAACGKSPPSKTGGTAALWALAPAGTIAGVVADGEATTALVARLATLARLSHELDGSGSMLQKLVTDSALGLDPTNLARCGIDPGLGAAAFMTPVGVVWVAPVRNRDRFAACEDATRDGDLDRAPDLTCATRHGHYVCTNRDVLLDRIGEGDAAIRASWPPATHGDVEAWVSPAVAQAQTDIDASFRATGPVIATATGSAGGITVRLHWPGQWRGETAPFVGQKAGIDADGSSSFMVFAAAPLVDDWARDVPRIQLLPGITSRDVVHALDGRIEGRVPAGTSAIDISLGLATPGVPATLVSRCKELGHVLPLDPDQVAGRCRISVPAAGTTFHVEGRVEGKWLRLTLTWDGAAGAPASVPLTPMARELSDGTWTFATWGRGSLLTLPWRRSPKPIDQLSAAVLEHVAEAGLGVRIGDDGLTALLYVRTIAADPDELADALEPLIAAAVRGRNVAARANALARRYPHSNFAGDLRAGLMGLAGPGLVCGAIGVGMAMSTSFAPGGPGDAGAAGGGPR